MVAGIIGVIGVLILVNAAGSPSSTVTGAIFVAGAVGLAAATNRRGLHVGPEGVVDVAVVRTRRLAWSEIYVARNLDLDGNGSDATLVAIDAAGHKLTLIRGRNRAQRRLVAAYINRLAGADYPGPRAVDVGPLVVIAVAVAFMSALAAIVVVALVFSNPHPSADPANLPPTRVYWTVVAANGQRSTYIDCPSPVEWLAGQHDELCADAARGAGTGIAVAFGIMAGLILVVVSIIRAVRDPNHDRR